MTPSEGYLFPDPRPWLLAATPTERRDEAKAWAEWIPALLQVSNVAWNDRQRKEALEAFRSGRMVRVPCGPPPAGSLSGELAGEWLAYVTLSASDRAQEAAWDAHLLPWARATAAGAGYKGAWRHPHIDAVAKALMLMARLDALRMGGSKALGEGFATEGDRQKAVWRECVQIRQYLADLLPIAEDLPRRAKGSFKYWWFSCLEWTRIAEKKGAALWREPCTISRAASAQITWQRWFGKLAFR